ncbi:MAG: phosphate/phosphite/phosphonate ABC transporter substrate-binding protein [Paracoccaceae bacterium]
MIASLPMYDMPPIRAANDRFWALIRDGLRANGIAAPDALTRNGETLWEQWLAPDLVLSQTCGLPFRSRLHDHVTRIGTPDYGLPGCPPGYYRSVFVAHRDDPRDHIAAFDGSDMAFNEGVSQSGWAAPISHAAKLGIRLNPMLQTGAHHMSLLAVANGRAPLAALDALSWDILQSFVPEAAMVKVVGQTDPTPGLCYISVAGADAAVMFRVISGAIAALSPEDRATTRLRGLVAISTEDYLAVPTPRA